MKLIKYVCVLMIAANFYNCASPYRVVNPETLNYMSTSLDDGVKLSYKYELLGRKYKKKEQANGVRLVAVKLTNNSGRDLVFGKDLKLTYDDGSIIYVMENDRVFHTLKQKPASYLWYLLLTPLNLYTSSTTSRFETKTNSIPIGLAVGPGLAGGNMIAAGSANKKFRNDLLSNNLLGRLIKNGETVSGLIGIRADDYHSMNVKIVK